MTARSKWLLAAAVALAATPLFAAETASSSIADVFGRDVRELTAWRIYASADGESHAEQVKFPAKEAAYFNVPNGRRTFMESAAQRMTILSVPPNVQTSAHTVPGRSLVLILRGGATLKVSDGTRVPFGPGTMFIFEDATGKGHSGDTGPEGYTALTISFPTEPPK